MISFSSTGDIDQSVVNITDVANDYNIDFIIYVLVGAVLLFIVAKPLVRSSVDRILSSHHYTSGRERLKRRKTLVGIFETVINALILIGATIFVLSLLGVNLVALVTGAGAVGILVGLVGQDLLRDYIKGAAIIIEDHYRIDDIVKIAGVSGMVENLTLRYTQLRDLDGNVHVVPNGQIAVATNMSRSYARVNIDINVSYDSDIDLVERIINEIGREMAESSEWKSRVIQPIQYLRLDKLDESAIVLKALGEVMPGDQWDAAGAFLRRLKIAFDQSGIVIPYPQRVIHTVLPSKKSASKKSTTRESFDQPSGFRGVDD